MSLATIRAVRGMRDSYSEARAAVKNELRPFIPLDDVLGGAPPFRRRDSGRRGRSGFFREGRNLSGCRGRGRGRGNSPGFCVLKLLEAARLVSC